MATHTQAKHLYEFGPFHLNVTERLLMREGRSVPLPPKVFETLLVLVENGGRIMEKDELIGLLWPDSFVEESSLSQNIFQVRKALGEGEYIETIPRRGYRFVAPVREVFSEAAAIRPPQDAAPGEIGGARAWRDGGWFDDADPLVGEQAAPDYSHRVEAARTPELPAGKSWQKTAAVIAVAAIVVVAFGIYRFILQRQPAKASPLPFHYMQMTKLTSNGRVLLQAVSPDGRYVAQAVEDAGQQSLWIRQTSTGSSVQLIPPSEAGYLGVAFSRDGNYIYYSHYPKKPHHIGELHQIPVLGGTPRKIVEDVDSALAVSPDGRQLVFIRNFPMPQERSLYVVNTDGTGERKLATRKHPNIYSLVGISWSPDGKLIAVPALNVQPEGRFMNIVGVRVEDGAESLLSPQRWNRVGQVAWLGDGSGLVAIAWHPDYTVFADQIWYLSYPKGETRRITNDLNGYSGLSIADDSSALTTIQATRLSSFWLVPTDKSGRAIQITSGFGDNYSETLGMAWLGKDRIVYGSNASGNADLWVMDKDGKNPKQLTTDGHSDVWPATSADGGLVSYVSYNSGIAHVWLMNPDGSGVRQLTSEEYEVHPSLSPDGRWVVYVVGGKSRQAIWKKPVDGGPAVQLTDVQSTHPVVSPDGKWLGCFLMDAQARVMRLAVLPFNGGAPRFINKEPTMADHGHIRWSPDSRALTFIRTQNGVSNIWSQPVDGGAPKQLTSFRSERIYRFGWSPDGRYLACERGVTVNDLVLVTNFMQKK